MHLLDAVKKALDDISLYIRHGNLLMCTHIFDDDFERKVEFSMNIFRQPIEVIKRADAKFSKENEQAHSIVHYK
jgi:hypothetical protein